MDSFQKPIGSAGPRAPHERPPSQPEPEENPPPDNVGALAFILRLLKNTLNLFLSRPEPALKKRNLSPLSNFKKFLVTLQTEDRSQDASFLNDLAKAWQSVLEMSLEEHPNEEKEKISMLLKKINTYPENELHTFGYYLSENTDQRWVPFPYMELIQKIHKGYENKPENCPLSEWINLIDEIISS